MREIVCRHPSGAVAFTLTLHPDGSETFTLPDGTRHTYSAEEIRRGAGRGPAHLRAMWFRRGNWEGKSLPIPPQGDDSDTPFVVGG